MLSFVYKIPWHQPDKGGLQVRDIFKDNNYIAN